jgi:hypothetical protein
LNVGALVLPSKASSDRRHRSLKQWSRVAALTTAEILQLVHTCDMGSG